MNCRAIEPLLFTERDGALTPEQRATLAQHVAVCPSCKRLRAQLDAALTTFRTDVANVVVPDIDAEWRTLHAQLPGGPVQSAKKRPLAPVIWFGSSLAAAAALVLVYLRVPPTRPPSVGAPAIVEAGDAGPSTMVYVDQESGWLVVWATESGTKTSG